MPWAVFVLLLANIAVGIYGLLEQERAGTRPDPRAREVNAEQVRVLRSGPANEKKESRAVPASAATASACLEWGSFAAPELERVRAGLASLGAERLIVRELGPVRAWWVHVPPLGSREEAERRARELAQAGHKDVRVVLDGERWRNAISLGIFRSEDAANEHLARLREIPVRNAAVVERSDLLRLGAILVVEPQPALVARIAELSTAYPGTELRAVACPAEAEPVEPPARTKEPQ